MGEPWQPRPQNKGFSKPAFLPSHLGRCFMWVFFPQVSNGMIACLDRVDSDIFFNQKKKKKVMKKRKKFLHLTRKPKGKLNNALKIYFHFVI